MKTDERMLKPATRGPRRIRSVFFIGTRSYCGGGVGGGGEEEGGGGILVGWRILGVEGEGGSDEL
jgi:hypothetical protein